MLAGVPTVIQRTPLFKRENADLRFVVNNLYDTAIYPDNCSEVNLLVA
jgi:hypothetical protein